MKGRRILHAEKTRFMARVKFPGKDIKAQWVARPKCKPPRPLTGEIFFCIYFFVYKN